MIFVMLGTQHNEFTRLLDEIENCINNGLIKENVVIQAGTTKYKGDKMKIFDLLPKDVLENLIKDASIVITHGGVGSIISALKEKKKVIAVPRLSEYNEHVNDHQRDIVNAFNEKGYIIGIQNVEDLPDAIERIPEFNPKGYVSDNSKLLNGIKDYIDKL